MTLSHAVTSRRIIWAPRLTVASFSDLRWSNRGGTEERDIGETEQRPDHDARSDERQADRGNAASVVKVAQLGACVTGVGKQLLGGCDIREGRQAGLGRSPLAACTTRIERMDGMRGRHAYKRTQRRSTTAATDSSMYAPQLPVFQVRVASRQSLATRRRCSSR
jgi:hypothetical protein